MPVYAREIRQDAIPHLLREMKRYWDFVDMRGDCWLWTGSGTSGRMNYGLFCATNHRYAAHRFLWAMLHGCIAADECLLHTCDTPLCVRPSHLHSGTQQDNMRDMHLKGRHRSRTLKGDESNFARLSQEKVLLLFEMHDAGLVTEEIGHRLGITGRQVRRILRREDWEHLEIPPHRAYKKTARLRPDQALAVRQLARKGVAYKEIAAMFGISPHTAYAIATRRTWPHLPEPLLEDD